MATVYSTRHTPEYEQSVNAVSALHKIIQCRLVDGVYMFLCKDNENTLTIASTDKDGNVSSHSGNSWNIGREWKDMTS
jgi:hypothetical protein